MDTNAHGIARGRVCPGGQFPNPWEPALEMLDESGGWLPHAWIAGDDEMGRSSGFTRNCGHEGAASRTFRSASAPATLSGSWPFEPPLVGRDRFDLGSTPATRQHQAQRTEEHCASSQRCSKWHVDLVPMMSRSGMIHVCNACPLACRSPRNRCQFIFH